MSYKIIIFQEIKKGKSWLYNGKFPYDENIPDLFGWLDANFKSEFKPIADDRGLPIDIAPLTRKHIKVFEEEQCGLSWLTFKEILDDVENDIVKQKKFEEFIELIKYLSENEDLNKIRIVFCFIP